MADTDDEQERKPNRHSAARPVGAAARRERRASARQAADGETATPPAKKRPPNKTDGKASAEKKSSTEKKGKPTPSRDQQPERVGVFARLARFFREVVGELRKVIWPTRKQMITYTTVVLIFLIVMTAFVFGLDTLFAKGVFWVFA